MNKKFSTMIRNPWMNRLLALTVCASMLLSSVAARPLVNSSANIPPSPTVTPLVTDPVKSVTPTVEPSTAVPTTEPAAATPTTPTTAVTPEPTQTAPEKANAAVTSVDPKRVNFRQIIFQFTNESGVSLNAQGLSAQSGTDITSVQNILKDSVVKPVFSGSGNTPVSAQSSSSSPNVYYYAQLPENVDVQTASQILESLKQDPSIGLAYMEPVYLPATAVLPIAANLTDQQGYLDVQDATHNGIDAKYAWTKPGGTGVGIRVYDIEGGWQIGHEDLNIHDSSLIDSSNSSQQDWVDHGTAVLGEIAGLNNSFGVTGIAYDAEIWLLSNVMDSSLNPRPLASAIDIAATDARPGDVIVLPLQALGPVSGETCTCPDPQCNDFEAIPVEYWNANFDAISAATNKGIIVVEAAGNGMVNLNDTAYQDRFNRNKRDSGALLVGAGTSDTREPMCLSNYGTRLDLQGWGDSIVTTGYGDLAGAEPNEFYTEQFGGTSGAAAIVAGAVASLQGVAKKRGYLLDSAQVLVALKDTGTPQGDPLTTKIGPLPNLQRAIDERLPQQIQSISPANGDSLYTLRPTLDWADYFNATKFEIQVATGSTFGNIVIDTTTTNTYFTIPSNLNKATFWWRVRPMVDTAWRGWSIVWSFTLVGSSVAAPILVSPSDRYVVPVVDPLFKWKAPLSTPAGYSYEFQISTLADFIEGPETITSDLAVTETNPVMVWNTRYYWRVRGLVVVSGKNNYSAWTSPRIISTALPPVASLNDPADGTDPLPILRPLFTWDAVTDARAYRLDIASADSFAASKIWKSINIPMPSESTIVPNEYQMVFDLLRNRTMYWRVRVLGLYGWSGSSPVSSFRTGRPAGVPTQTSPLKQAVINHFDPDGPTLRWSTPSGGPVGYEVEVFDSHDFTLPPFFTDAPTAPDTFSVVSGLAPDSILYWHVRSINMDGVYSNWSPMRIFYTTPLPPANLIDPGDGADAATVGSLKPTFNWDKVDIARTYRIQIARDDGFTKVVVSTVITNSPPYTLTTTLPITTLPYYWRVSAGGLYGYSEPSGFFSFFVPDPPGTPELVYPANGTVLSTFAPVLDWNKSPSYPATSSKYADEYQVQVATSTSFNPDPAITVIDQIVLSPETKYAIGAADLPAAGIYYFRVRAHNIANNFYSIWSGIRSFTTPPWVDGTIEDMSATALEAVTLQIAGTSWSTLTDSSGVFNFKGLPAGNYDMYVSKNGFIRQVRNITITSGKMLDLNLNMVEIPPAGTITIMLTWNKSPEDLDAHLWLPATAPTPPAPPSVGHINKDNLGGLGAFPDALLSGNVAVSYGMEVITIDALYSGIYEYGVYLNGTSDEFPSSQARVVVYDGSTLKKSYLVPDSGSGNWWKVFKIDGPTRSIIDQNVITSKNPQLYPD